MRDYGFKYQVGDLVTHVGFLKPVRQPSVQRFRVMTQTLIAGPVMSQRVYCIRPVSRLDRAGGLTSHLRVQEEHLVSWPDEVETLPEL